MPRFKDIEYDLRSRVNGQAPDRVDDINIGLLMDLRDELKENNALRRRILAVLECHNTTMIPRTLARIDRRLAKKIPLK